MCSAPKAFGAVRTGFEPLFRATVFRLRNKPVLRMNLTVLRREHRSTLLRSPRIRDDKRVGSRYIQGALMGKTKTETTRLIVAASETDADMLYATKFWAPDPFIFLEQNGKRTLVLTDLEIDRGRKQAKANEFVAFSKL